MRILGYVRCAQNDDADALRHQIRTIRDHFAERGVKVPIVAEPSAELGSMWERPLLDQLLDGVTADARPFDILAVTDRSRISRNLERALDVEAKLRNAGIALLAISELDRSGMPQHDRLTDE